MSINIYHCTCTGAYYDPTGNPVNQDVHELVAAKTPDQARSLAHAHNGNSHLVWDSMLPDPPPMGSGYSGEFTHWRAKLIQKDAEREMGVLPYDDPLWNMTVEETA